MTLRACVGCVSVALSLTAFAQAALGQRLRLSVAPPSPSTLGQQVSLGVRPALTGTMYRYVATMTVTGTGMFTAGTSCATPQTIGSKSDWASGKGLGGSFVWELSGDTPDGELIKAIR